jgi:hypothetical protein
MIYKCASHDWEACLYLGRAWEGSAHATPVPKPGAPRRSHKSWLRHCTRKTVLAPPIRGQKRYSLLLGLVRLHRLRSQMLVLDLPAQVSVTSPAPTQTHTARGWKKGGGVRTKSTQHSTSTALNLWILVPLPGMIRYGECSPSTKGT